MYFAMLMVGLALYVWPDQGIVEVPFSQLTLKMLATAAFALWLGYLAIRLGFDSLSKDRFWPWRWTRQIVKFLSIRLGLLVAIVFGSWMFLTQTKFGPWLSDHPVLSAIAIFISVTYVVCVDDRELT